MDQREKRVESRGTCEYVPSWDLIEIMWNFFLHNNVFHSESNKNGGL